MLDSLESIGFGSYGVESAALKVINALPVGFTYGPRTEKHGSFAQEPCPDWFEIIKGTSIEPDGISR